MNNTPRERLLNYLLELDKRKPVETQLRDKWLKELQEIQNEKHNTNTTRTTKHDIHLGV